MHLFFHGKKSAAPDKRSCSRTEIKKKERKQAGRVGGLDTILENGVVADVCAGGGGKRGREKNDDEVGGGGKNKINCSTYPIRWC